MEAVDMWTLAIFLTTGGQAFMMQTPTLETCLAEYKSQIANGSFQSATVERAMCTPPLHGDVQWIVKPKAQ